MSLDVYLEETPCPHCGRSGDGFSANITHNLHAMATAAGIGDVLWEPENHGITEAEQLIDPLEKGILAMRSDPEKFKAFDAPNGWGTYKDFVPWLERYLEACRSLPKARVSVSR